MKKNLILWMILGTIIFATSYAGLFGKKKEIIKIGHKNFTEQRILGQMLSIAIEKNTNYKTDVREFGGTMLVNQALKTGQIDLSFEYTGTGYQYLLKGTGLKDPEKIYEYCVTEFAKQGITWLNPMGFNNTYAFAVKEELAQKYNLNKYSDFVGVAEKLKVGALSDFFSRPDGMPGIKKTYGFTFKEEVAIDTGLKYIAVEQGKIDVAVAYATDGMLKKYNLKVLEDDKHFFPPYDAVPRMKTEFANSHPEIVKVLKEFNRNFTNEDFQKYNYQVDVLGYPEKKVAEEALKEKGII
ncbi:osmoprotectant transport system substrate-binding protein [Hypnocyclicus thermotrophus]|uniref:Osmoprotectant transport system substrate-binding protein n=1 Tax=Hypnocyclicus thermotrophus TaxID=1627895 RepID=A0AA46DZE2_9FUSO|nr:glycine betaine ABC transporter substrate-binding protein [Hypnocyclicus thermotrophus]TDT71571.1 osmoprotectant transport system substrate-binding protein [Hypnocyclicus thermotrophus]